MERLVSSRSRLTPFLVPSLSVPLRPPGRPLADGTVWRRYRGRGVSLGSHACHTLVTHTACLIRALCHSSRPSLGARLRRYGECDESVVRDAVVKGRVRGGIRLETERDVERRDRRRPPPFPLLYRSLPPHYVLSASRLFTHHSSPEAPLRGPNVVRRSGAGAGWQEHRESIPPIISIQGIIYITCFYIGT